MVTVAYEDSFEKSIRKLKDSLLKEKIKKQIRKIIQSPEIGKPMKFSRKGTREIYVSPFRLAYTYSKNADKIVFCDLYHKDEQ